MKDREPVYVLAIGSVLSLVLVIPSALYSGRFGGGSPLFHVIFNLILLAALASPFVGVYFFTRKGGRAVEAVTLGTVFGLCHGWLIYVNYAFKPQEFGYVGLVFAPFLEVFVGIPIAFLVVVLAKRWSRT